MTTDKSTRPDQASPFRWWVLALLFLATTINYMDRQALSVLKPILAKSMHWSEADYGWITFAFQASYSVMYTVSGRLVDVLGTRTGFALGVVLWSVAAMGHAAVRSALGFAIARFALGTGEGVNFPACLKAIAEWFPQRERALAAGVFNSGSSAGIIFAGAAVWIANRSAPQLAFVVTGGMGLVWLGLWLAFYRSAPISTIAAAAGKADAAPGAATTLVARPGAGSREIAAPEGAAEAGGVRWTTLLRYPQIWPFLLAKFLTDPVWWFYLYWLPSYLTKERHLSLSSSVIWLVIPYLAAGFGSVGGGGLSDYLIQKGWTPARARFTGLLVCALCMPWAIGAVYASNMWVAVILISLATSGHQGLSSNLYTTATDMFPARVAGLATGMGGSAGSIGGMLMTLLVGGSLEWFHSYVPIFIWAGSMHLIAFLCMFVLLKGQLPVADVRTDADRRPSRGLLVGGLVTAAVGAAGAAAAVMHWSYLVAATNSTLKPGQAPNPSAAAGGLACTVGVTLVGLALVYASRGRKG